jgi:hypothetical protein
LNRLQKLSEHPLKASYLFFEEIVNGYVNAFQTGLVMNPIELSNQLDYCQAPVGRFSHAAFTVQSRGPVVLRFSDQSS